MCALKIAETDFLVENSQFNKSKKLSTYYQEFEKFLDFIDTLDDEASRILTLQDHKGETRMVTFLLRNHLQGKLTTSTSLVGVSGMAYGTAVRTVNSLIDRGLIVKRAKTTSGKSFSLHPSEQLLIEWHEFARRIQVIISTTLGTSIVNDGSLSEYFYGASYSKSTNIPAPKPLSEKLGLRNELKLLAHADPTFMAMSVLKKQFEELFGNKISSKALSIDRLRLEILSNARRTKSRHDIIACDLPWFGEMALNKALLPLDDLIKGDDLDLSDFHQVAVDSCKFEGQIYGIPVQTTPELLVVRKDLFEEYGLAVPFTAENTLKAAKALHNKKRGLSGIAWNAARGTPLGHTFMFVMAAMGRCAIDLPRLGEVFDASNPSGENLRPMLLTDQSYEAAEYLLELLDFSPTSILSMSWYERAKAYADGNVAMAYSATLLAPMFESNPSSPAYGVTEYLPHPHGRSGTPIAPVGGYALAIPANIEPERVKPTWRAIKALTSPEYIKMYIEHGSLVSPRYSVSLDDSVRQRSALIGKVDSMARSGVLQYWPRPPVPEASDLIAIIGSEIHDMLQGAKSVTRALSDAQNKVDVLMRKRDRY